MQPQQPFGKRNSRSQLFQGDAGRVGRENSVLLHQRRDRLENLALDLGLFRNRLNHQISLPDTIARKIRYQPIGCVASGDPAMQTCIKKLPCSSDCCRKSLFIEIGQRDPETARRAPCGNIPAHCPGTDNVNLRNVARPLSSSLQSFTQEEDMDEILRRLTGQKTREGADFLLLHHVFIPGAVVFPKVDQSMRGGIMFLRRTLGSHGTHLARGETPIKREAAQTRAAPCRFQISRDGRFDRVHDMSLLGHGVDQAKLPCLGCMHGFSSQHHLHGFDRIDQRRQPERPSQSGMKSEKHFGKPEDRSLDSYPEPARESQLEPAAEAMAVDHRNARHGERCQTVNDRMGPRHAGFHHIRLRNTGKIANIGSGDKTSGFARA